MNTIEAVAGEGIERGAAVCVRSVNQEATAFLLSNREFPKIEVTHAMELPKAFSKVVVQKNLLNGVPVFTSGCFGDVPQTLLLITDIPTVQYVECVVRDKYDRNVRFIPEILTHFQNDPTLQGIIMFFVPDVTPA